MYSIQEVVAATSVTSRTLRHYDSIGLLPARRDRNGYRAYEQNDLVRLQRILMLRDLGLGLPEIARVLAGQTDDASALRQHVLYLESERERIDRQIHSVQRTLEAIRMEEEMTTHDMFDGFDHTQYKDEVVDRWGEEAYTASDTWWRSLDGAGWKAFEDESSSLIKGFADASARGLDVHGSEVQALARRQYEWIRASWGGTAPSAEAFTGLGQMYVDDPRFGKTYSVDGREFAAFVRDAMVAFAEKEL